MNTFFRPHATGRCHPVALAGLTALLWLAAGWPAASGAAEAVAAAAQPPASAARPARLQARITLEGATEPIWLTLFEWTPAAPSPGLFTYVPQDMLARPSSGDALPALRFIANFGGTLQAQAYLEIAWLPLAVSRQQAAARVGRVVPGTAPLRRRDPSKHQFGWSLDEYDIAYRSKSGSRIGGITALGRHGQRYFKLTLHYPLEYGAGFGPRAQLILDAWRWRDTQTGL